METIQMTQKVRAIGNWWSAASSQRCTRLCFTSCAELFGETWNHPGDSVPLHPTGTLRLLAFPQRKITLKEKRFQTIDEIQENTMKQLIAIERIRWDPKVPTLKGTEASLSYAQCFSYLVSSSMKVSIFHILWLDTFWTDLVLLVPNLFQFSHCPPSHPSSSHLN